MLTLKLFGPPAIEAAGGLVSGRAAQGHRLALLAVLVLARGRPVGRDRLVALLWPESPTDRARHQLSDTLYLLRGRLGADVVRTAGDELVLNPDAVTSDVGAFERLLDAGDPEAAVALCTGPLLDGFHLADGIEFEHWLEAERARLGQRHAAALEALAAAGEQRGDFTAAAGWWRRLAAHDPYAGRVALRLMRALEAAGDRAGAIRHARVHAALLREEFEAEPDPDVTAFAERLRTGPAPRPAPQPPTVGPGPRAEPAAAPPAGRDPAAEGNAGAPMIDAMPSVERVPSRPRPWSARAAVATAALLVVLAVAAAWGAGFTRGATAAPAARSLAVMPFVNMSPDPATGYFGDGLSEQILTVLSRIPSLRVAARTSSFALRDAELDVRAIGDTLGVETVLEGSVRQEGRRLRVTAQLIDAATGYHLWSGEYDREVTDVLAVQDEIAGAIAAALELRLPSHGAPPGAARPPAPAAYDLYLRARYLRDDLSGDALRSASDLLDRVVELEPGFAPAWAEKASVMAPRMYYGHVSRQQGVPAMRAAIARALELDPGLAEAHVALGILRLFFERDWAGAEFALRRAVELNPSDPHAWHHLGNQLRVIGRLEDAVDAYARSVALDPLNARMRINLANNLATVGRLDEAAAQYERTRQLDPLHPNALGLGPSPPMGAGILQESGRIDAAADELLRVAALRGATPDELDAMRAARANGGMGALWRSWLEVDLRLAGSAVNPFRVAKLWALTGDVEQALDWLERAHAAHDPGIIFLRTDPAFEALHDHPRFARILTELRLPPR